MRNRYILSLAALALPLMVSARPAYPGLMELRNADGSVVEGYLYGDASFNWAVSADGQSLLENVNGKWVPAVREGRRLAPQSSDIDLLRSETAQLDCEIGGCSVSHPGKQRMAQLDAEGRTSFPTVGDDVHSMVVLIEYADTKFTVPNIKEAINKMCNEVGYSDYGSKGSARDYYAASSNGKFQPTFDIYGPVTVSHNSEYYVGAGSGMVGEGSNAYFGYAIQEALEKLHESGEVDFSKYDYDEDGLIDNIFFFYAGHGQADTGDPTTIWPHQSDWLRYTYDFTLNLPRISYDGVEFRTYACSNELLGKKILPNGGSQPYLDGIGAFVHEFGHVLGLPDTYSTTSDNTPTPGYWDVMAQGTYNDYSTRPPLLNGYEQWVCRWAEYIDLKEPGHYEVPSMSCAYAEGKEPVLYRMRLNRPGSSSTYYPEYFVFETHTKDYWDTEVADEGMMIYHVDYNKTVWMNNQVNVNGRSRFIYMTTSKGSPVFPGTSYPVTSMYPGSETWLPIATVGASSENVFTNISFDAEKKVASFDFNLASQPTDATVMLPVSNVDPSRRAFTLSWEPLEGMTNYYLTLRRKNSAGSAMEIANGYNETDLGNVTSIRIQNISPTAWDRDYEAYVRCGDGIPSLNVSNTLKFNPAHVNESGVNEVELARDVYTGTGCILAPEGARVYNTAGVETGTDNLAPGMYIVTLDGQAVKVVVK